VLDKIERNHKYSDLLGWSPHDYGGETVDGHLVDLITSAQVKLGVVPDGIAGPASYCALIDTRIARLLAGRSGSDDWLRDAGMVALLKSKRVWLERVIDPPTSGNEFASSRSRIDQVIRSTEGLGWDWLPPYQRVNDFEWCGAFASYAWRAAGTAASWRRSFFSSTYRLDLWARYLPFEHAANPRPPTGPARKWFALNEHTAPSSVVFGPGDGPRAGDILLVGPTGSDYGAHVTLVESYDSGTGTFTTIEGNGTGLWPTGEHVRGVVRARRPVGARDGATYHARRLIRPAVTDLTFA
jgi:CHAP domain